MDFLVVVVEGEVALMGEAGRVAALRNGVPWMGIVGFPLTGQGRRW